MGRIQGRILFSDGQTPAEGYNLIAHQVENPRVIAVSLVSGFLFTSNAGKPKPAAKHPKTILQLKDWRALWPYDSISLFSVSAYSFLKGVWLYEGF
jgi:hypothetical protein